MLYPACLPCSSARLQRRGTAARDARMADAAAGAGLETLGGQGGDGVRPRAALRRRAAHVLRDPRAIAWRPSGVPSAPRSREHDGSSSLVLTSVSLYVSSAVSERGSRAGAVDSRLSPPQPRDERSSCGWSRGLIAVDGHLEVTRAMTVSTHSPSAGVLLVAIVPRIHRDGGCRSRPSIIDRRIAAFGGSRRRRSCDAGYTSVFMTLITCHG